MQRKQLVLIVEGQPLDRKLIRDVLQAKGYSTLKTETGEDGFDLATRNPADLMLMDIQLPGIDGIETLKRLRVAPTTHDIPVIDVTQR